MHLQQEADEIERLVADKVVSSVRRHRSTELLIEFTDGTRLFVNTREEPLEFSITGFED